MESWLKKIIQRSNQYFQSEEQIKKSLYKNHASEIKVCILHLTKFDLIYGVKTSSATLRETYDRCTHCANLLEHEKCTQVIHVNFRELEGLEREFPGLKGGGVSRVNGDQKPVSVSFFFLYFESL